MNKLTEIQKILGDTVKIIESQVRMSPYWMLDHKNNITLTHGDINRLYYALDVVSILLHETQDKSDL